jgi:hypothetical protein
LLLWLLWLRLLSWLLLMLLWLLRLHCCVILRCTIHCRRQFSRSRTRCLSQLL